VLIAVGLAAVKAASQSAATSVVAIDVESDPVRIGLAASFETPDRLGFPEAKTIVTT
jgi:Zn-dependent alcohol dehydrogenase